LSRFFATGSKVGIQAADVKPLKLILATLNAATLPGDMGLPGLKRHPPKKQSSRFLVSNGSSQLASHSSV
jgi:plasmid maintenance system killer protein